MSQEENSLSINAPHSMGISLRIFEAVEIKDTGEIVLLSNNLPENAKRFWQACEKHNPVRHRLNRLEDIAKMQNEIIVMCMELLEKDSPLHSKCKQVKEVYQRYP